MGNHHKEISIAFLGGTSGVKVMLNRDVNMCASSSANFLLRQKTQFCIISCEFCEQFIYSFKMITNLLATKDNGDKNRH